MNINETHIVILSESTVDSANRVLKNVVLIRAGMSKNRRLYSEKVLKAATPMFENVRAYADHDRTNQARSVRDLTGYYKNPRFERGAIRADRYFTENEAGRDVWAIAQEIVSGRAPKDLAGLSINAYGEAKSAKDSTNGEYTMIESLTSITSVDDVYQAAAGGGYVNESLRESVGSGRRLMTLKEGLQSFKSFEAWEYQQAELFVEDFKARMVQSDGSPNWSFILSSPEHLTIWQEIERRGIR